MRMCDIIKKKRDGSELSDQEIRFFVEGAADGSIPSYQIAALLMAIYFRGMSDRETMTLTFAIRDSGDILKIDGYNGVRVDKHSTGGVGDKTSLVVMPIVGACGLKVAKMSGRGLGHTGGTIDKLCSIKGFNTSLTTRQFLQAVEDVGVAIVGQSKNLAPADKILYALRDVTATVDCLPLIVSSIMGKKLAADDDCIVLDVKVGSGAFTKTIDDGRLLATKMVDIGKSAGKKMTAVITDMDSPLGYAIGNSLEVIEAIETLSGNGPQDLTELSLELSADMLTLSGMGNRQTCLNLAVDALRSGAALKKFADMVRRQGGDERYVYDTSLFVSARLSRDVIAIESGYVNRVDAEGYGNAALYLGAGRNRADDEIDYEAGILLRRKRGDKIKVGDVIATLYTNAGDLDAAEQKVRQSTFIGAKPSIPPLIIDRIGD